MRNHSLVMTLFAVLIAGASTSAQTLQFSLTDLGAFGGISSDAKSVNANGEIVGYYTTSTAQQKCFYWKSSVNGGYSTWTSPNAGGTCIVYSINNNGIMAGTSTLTNGNYSAFSATRVYSCNSHRLCTWNINSTYLSSPYGLSTYGAKVSDAGTVIGTSADGPSTYRASAWTNGMYSQLAGDTSSGSVSYSYTDTFYNQTDQYDYFSQTTNGQTRAYYTTYYWDGSVYTNELSPLSTAFVNSGVLDGSGYYSAGWSYADDNLMHATWWLYSDPEDIGAGPNSFATGIDLFATVGQWQGGSVPFFAEDVFQCPGAVVNLQSLLDSSGAGWTLLEANAIASPGHSIGWKIVGSARNSLNQTHAVLLTANSGTLCP